MSHLHKGVHSARLKHNKDEDLDNEISELARLIGFAERLVDDVSLSSGL